jgi:tripartite-type tricarboxylate transporter receptor subunit TctC
MSDTYRPSRRALLKTALAGGAALTALDPFTQALAAYPDSNIDVVIPTRAGGGADRLFRAVTAVWKTHLKTNFQPGFFPGASGRVGYEVFMGKKEPNAYNLLFGNMGPELLNWVVKKPTFPIKDCVYFGRIDNDAACIFVSAKSKFKTIDDIVAEGKKRQLNVGTSRLAHPASIGVLALAEHTGAKFNLIPLSGGKNTIAGAITGEVDFSALPASSVVVSGDQTRALLIFDETNPLPSKLNNAPTMNAHFKTKLPPLLSSRAFAIHKAAIDKYPDRFKVLQETLKKTAEDPALKEQLKKAGSDPAFLHYGGLEGCQKFAEQTLELGEHYKALLTGKSKKKS